MRHILRIFFKTRGGNAYVLMLCLLLGSVAGSIGLASMLPLLSMITGSASTSPVQGFLHDLFAAVGVPLSVGPVLSVVIGGLIVKELLTLVVQRYIGSAFANVITILRQELINNLLAVEWSYLLRNQIGRFSNAASVQAKASGDAYQASAQFVALAVQTIVLIVVALFVSWKLSLAAVALGGAGAFLVRSFIRTARRTGRQQTARTREFVAFLSDTISNLKPLKAMARTQAFAAMFQPKIEAIRKASRRQQISKEALKSVQAMISAAMLGVGFYVALTFFDIKIADIIVVGLFMSASLKNLNKLQAQYQQAVMLEPTYREFNTLLAETRAISEPNPGTAAAQLEQGCAFEDVGFGYGDHPVLNNVSLTVPVARVTVLIGPSGSGKTTLVDLLLGLYRPTSGRVLVDGVSLTEIDLGSWRRLLGYVPQDLVLFHDTVRNNITLGDAGISREDIDAALQLAGAAEFVAQLPLGLETVVGERGGRLSGGQRQRIALARALVIKPKLLILDEVTSALDPETEREIVDNLLDLRRAKPETTILAITHRPAFLDLADRIYRIDHGEVVAVAGPPRSARALGR